MTRAKDHLQLMVPQRFYVHQQAGNGDRHVYATRSRFISNAVARQFAETQRPLASTEGGEQRAVNPNARVDLAARMKGMWK